MHYFQNVQVNDLEKSENLNFPKRISASDNRKEKQTIKHKNIRQTFQTIKII